MGKTHLENWEEIRLVYFHSNPGAYGLFCGMVLKALGPEVNGRVHTEQLTLSCSVRVEACSRVKQLSPGGMSGKGTGRRGVKGYSGQSVGFKSHNIPLNAT